jgi:hypothetical protein
MNVIFSRRPLFHGEGEERNSTILVTTSIIVLNKTYSVFVRHVRKIAKSNY